jgi:hypothetical protein
MPSGGEHGVEPVRHALAGEPPAQCEHGWPGSTCSEARPYTADPSAIPAGVRQALTPGQLSGVLAKLAVRCEHGGCEAGLLDNISFESTAGKLASLGWSLGPFGERRCPQHPWAAGVIAVPPPSGEVQQILREHDLEHEDLEALDEAAGREAARLREDAQGTELLSFPRRGSYWDDDRQAAREWRRKRSRWSR